MACIVTDIDAENNGKLDKMTDEILRIVECPACLNIMSTSIYVCMTGHSLCLACWTALTNCPLCGEELATTRNHALESVVSALCYPCDNKEFGCDRILTAYDITAHSRVCGFKLYQCKIYPELCTFEGRHDELQKHIYQAHPFHAVQGSPNCFVWRGAQQSSTQMIFLEKEQFYLYMVVKDNNMCWIVQYLGNFEDDNMEYTFRVWLKKGKKQEIRSFMMSEYCIDNSAEDIGAVIDSGRCVAIPMQIFNSYKSHNGVRYLIDIKIEKASEKQL